MPSVAVDYNRNRQPVLLRFYLDNLNSKGVIVWVAPVIECKSHRLCPINALFSNIVIGQTEPDLECIHTYWSPLNLPIKWHQIYSKCCSFRLILSTQETPFQRQCLTWMPRSLQFNLISTEMEKLNDFAFGLQTCIAQCQVKKCVIEISF